MLKKIKELLFGKPTVVPAVEPETVAPYKMEAPVVTASEPVAVVPMIVPEVAVVVALAPVPVKTTVGKPKPASAKKVPAKKPAARKPKTPK